MSRHVAKCRRNAFAGSMRFRRHERLKLFQNAGSVQEIVHQRIDRDYLTARLKPVGSGAWVAIKTSDDVIVRTLSVTP